MAILKRALRIAIVAGTIFVGVIVVALIAIQTAWFKDWLRRYVSREAAAYLNGELAIGRLDGNLFTGVELQNVQLTQAGKPVVLVKDLGLRYSVINFITTGVVIDSIRINQPKITLVRGRNGWNVASLVKEQRQEANREGPARPVRMGDIRITDGTVTIDDRSGAGAAAAVRLPQRLEKLDLNGTFAYEPVRFTVELGHLSFRADAPSLAVNELQGRISVRNDDLFVDRLTLRTAESSLIVDGAVQDYLRAPVLNSTISSDTIVLSELSGLVPALERISLRPSFRVALAGPLTDLQVDGSVRTDAGRVDTKLRGDVQSATRAVRGTVNASHVDLGRVLGRADLTSDLTGTATVDLKVRSVDDVHGTANVTTPAIRLATYRVDSLRADANLAGRRIDVRGTTRAYGASATVDGEVTRPARAGDVIGYDLRGQVSSVDLSRLPLPKSSPRPKTNLNSAYHVRGAGDRTAADLRLRPSEVEGATIADGTRVRVAMEGKRLAYAAEGAVAHLNPQRLGRALGQETLAQDRFAGDLNAAFNVEGAGRTLADLVVNGDLALQNSTIAGGRVPELSLSGRVEHESLTGAVRGRVEDIDPGLLSGKQALAGKAGAAVDLRIGVANLSKPLDPAGLNTSGRVDLAPSRVGTIEVRTGAVQGSLNNQVARIDQLALDSSVGIANASGTVALGREDQSNLKYDVALTDLAAIGKLASADIGGTARLTGTITGNGELLSTRGTLSASHLNYATTANAVSISTEYEVATPDLDVQAVRAKADTTATFVHVAGRDLKEIVAKTTYAPREATFDVTASEETRALTARGRVALLPESREVQLESLGLRSGDVTWATPAGSPGRVTYDGERVSIDGLSLVNGDQRIKVGGVVALKRGEAAVASAQTETPLAVTAENVDLASLDDVTIGDRGLAGRLNASARLTGSLDDPHAQATAQVANGAFRNFKFEDLNTAVEYDTRGARVDVRLRQSPQAELTVKGTVPLSTKEGEAYPLDVRLQSGAIDLGLVQGFTTAVRDVTGTLAADVRATGSLQAPRIDGDVTVRQGGLTVDPTGAKYTGLDGHIRLAGDHIQVESLRVLDDGGDPLEATGGITLRDHQVGSMEVAAKATHFRLLDNELGNVQADIDLHVTGEPLKPTVRGNVSVHEGRIELDRMLEQLQTGLYATQSLSSTAGVSPSAVPTSSAPPPASSAPPSDVALDVHLKVPNNLVIRGDDVKVGGKGMSLGNVNITLGGDIRATKASGDQPRVTGEVRTVRGYYEFQGRRFTVDRDGRVSFSGPDPTDPALNVTARRDISGVEAVVTVTGTAQKPALELSSTPPLDQADILSLIVFNRPINELGQGEQASLAQTAQSVVGGMVAAPLAESLRDALNVDLLDIQAVSDEGGPSVTIGNQLSEKVFLQFRQLFGSAEATEVVLEYQLKEYLRLQSSFTEGGGGDRQSSSSRADQSGVDLIFTFNK
jgi:hypothetical protein